ncbi:hypothetical protein GGD63_006736 [Bradyrhizobium sp. cir1]|uniref:DUF3237 domain-containing protein n=1 Tax=Bradyrhizobium sp. cir1 TaxID=1445730 RepID=UPI001606A87F|nr:DUF3237 domain-containing protein [Bradyrhizobium sp. cir1]MBB4373907.1 hypothetical protein [Bradyrhizobium sp. cir1]
MRMKFRECLRVSLGAFTFLLMAELSATAGGPTASLQTEFLMTLYASLDPPEVADANLLIFNVPAGWVEGPRIKGKILPPSADWGRIMPGGVFRVDVRGTIQTDDGEMIFISYNGARQCPKEVQERFVKGEVLKADECYFVTAPTFQTKSEKYGWLNAIQAVGKMVEQKRGEGSFVKYDIFAVK